MGIAEVLKRYLSTERQNVAEYQNGTWDCCTERKTALSWPDRITFRYPITCRSVPRSDWHSKTQCQVFVIGEENHFYSKMSKTAPQNWRTVPCVRIVSTKLWGSWNATPCNRMELQTVSPAKKANEKKPCVERYQCPQDFLDCFLVNTSSLYHT